MVPAALEPAVVLFVVAAPAALEPAVVPAALDPAALEPAALEPAAVPAALEPVVVAPAVPSCFVGMFLTWSVSASIESKSPSQRLRIRL